MTGLTAYFGIIDIGKVQPGDFVVVSGAAGATGSVACQIAKLKGAKVLGIAGSEEKVQWLKELGCDDALNYKSESFATDFRAKTPDLIDVFFDNVGGEVLELALNRSKPHSRFVMCGAISQYNSAKPVGPKVCSFFLGFWFYGGLVRGDFLGMEANLVQNFTMVIAMRIKFVFPPFISRTILLTCNRVQGFLVFDYADQFDAARKELSQWLTEGKIQRKETIMKGGLAIADRALKELFDGVNTGMF